MFDLDLLEEDYYKNSFCLSEEEIIKIYQKEDVTLSAYEKELDDYLEKTRKIRNMGYENAEEKILLSIFEPEKVRKIEEERQKLIERIPKVQKPHLSKESQKKVIEGCLFIVFQSTRAWFNYFQGKIELEKIYYLCLESLINCVKYMIHCEKPVFELYVLKSIERSIIKYVSRKEHISYRDAYEIIHYLEKDFKVFDYDSGKEIKLCFDYENKESVEKPSKIFYRLKDEHIDIDYLEDIRLDEFRTDYNLALDNFSEEEKMVLILSYDLYGYRGLTIKEIADYLGTDIRKISNIKKRVIRTLRKDERFIRHL